MTSDAIKPRGDVRFLPVGTGHHPLLRCGKCQATMPNAGRKLVKVRGAKLWIGKCCQTPPNSNDGVKA
jgi:hypothetical protein